MLHSLRRQTLNQGIELYHEGQFAEARNLLEQVWALPNRDIEAFEPLFDCLLALEDWTAAEMLLVDLESTDPFTGVAEGARMVYYLAKGDVDEAVAFTFEFLKDGRYMDEFWGEVIWKFSAKGQLSALEDGINRFVQDAATRDLLRAKIYQYGYHDTLKAIYWADQAAEKAPDSEKIQTFQHQLRRDFGEEIMREGRHQLTTGNPFAAANIYKKGLQINPNDVFNQEVYLTALAVYYFPPFRWYFLPFNIMAQIPIIARACLYATFMVFTGLYYKESGKNAPEQVSFFIPILSCLVLPRYVLLPIFVQLIALVKVPGYHLLKRKSMFYIGALIATAWLYAVISNWHGVSNGWRYAMAGGILFNSINTIDIETHQNTWVGKVLWIWNVLTISCIILGMTNLLPIDWGLWAMSGFLVPILFVRIVAFLKKTH